MIETLDQQLGRPSVSRPPGELLWVHLGSGANAPAVARLIERLADERDPVALLVTQEDGMAHGFAEGAILQHLPVDSLSAVQGFLDHWRPDACLWAGGGWHPVLLSETRARAIPAIAVDARMDDAHARQRRWRRGLARAELAAFDRLLTGDQKDAARLIAFGAPADRVETAGTLEIGTGALPCNEAEWTSLAIALTARPVWLAVAVAPDEIEKVVQAHRRASRLAHRLLFIFVPADPACGPALRNRLEAENWQTALRSARETPSEETQILVVDTPGDLGLWYRLAPVTFMGGTLSGSATGRSPMEPAALGSVVVHGARIGVHSTDFARLQRVGASCEVSSADELGRAVERLQAPDKAAELACNAWAELTAGAEASDRALDLLNDALNRSNAGR